MEALGSAAMSSRTWRRRAKQSSLKSACSSMTGNRDPALARCESIPAIGVIPMPALANTIGRPALSSSTTAPDGTEMVSTSPTSTVVCSGVVLSILILLLADWPSYHPYLVDVSSFCPGYGDDQEQCGNDTPRSLWLTKHPSLTRSPA